MPAPYLGLQAEPACSQHPKLRRGAAAPFPASSHPQLGLLFKKYSDSFKPEGSFLFIFFNPLSGHLLMPKTRTNRCRVSKVSFSHLSDCSLPLRSSWDSSCLEGCFLPVSSAGASVYLGPQMLCLGLRCCPFSLDTPFEAYIPADVSQISVHSSELSPELVADNSNAN